MNQKNQRGILIVKIALVIILVGYLVGIFINPQEIWAVTTGNYYRSDLITDGLDRYLEKQYPNVVFSNFILQGIISLISPDWRWIVYHNENSIVEFASIEDPYLRLTDTQPGELIDLVSWSPDGQTLVATTFTGTEKGLNNFISDKIILFRPIENGYLERHEFSLASVLKSGTPYISSHSNPFAWSPDRKLLAIMTHPASAIVIIDDQAKHVQTIPIQVKTTYPYLPTSDIYWTSKGLVYLYATSIDPKHYKLMLVDLENPNQHVEIMEVSGEYKPSILGNNGSYLLVSEKSSSPPKCKSTLLNIETLQIEKTKNTSNKCFVSRNRDFPNMLYVLLVTKNEEMYDEYWIFSWETTEFKKLFINDYLAVTGWNSTLDGIGVLRGKTGGGIELWVVKP